MAKRDVVMRVLTLKILIIVSLISVNTFAQEYNFDYLLTYSFNHSDHKTSTLSFFVDSSNPNAHLMFHKAEGQEIVATVEDVGVIHKFQVKDDPKVGARLIYLDSKSFKETGVIEKKAKVRENQRADGKVDVTVDFYLREKSKKSRITYQFVMRKSDVDLASQVLPHFFDSRHRLTLVKFSQNYVIESKSSQFSYYEPSISQLVHFEKLAEPILVDVKNP